MWMGSTVMDGAARPASQRTLLLQRPGEEDARPSPIRGQRVLTGVPTVHAMHVGPTVMYMENLLRPQCRPRDIRVWHKNWYSSEFRWPTYGPISD